MRRTRGTRRSRKDWRPWHDAGVLEDRARHRGWSNALAAGKAAASAPWAPLPIAPKELRPVVLAAAVWGESWSGASVLLECDSTVVVAAVRSGSSRDAALMPLLRTLQFFAAQFGFAWRERHIPGEQKTLADGLSRNVPPAALRASFFLSLPPIRRPSRGSYWTW